ncbi:MAG: hypothetical protein ABIP01_02550 [Candidatus Limnocylindria bacterium]
MLEDPGLDAHELTDALRTAYGVEATGFSFVPGYDMHAASYGVATSDGGAFAKLRTRRLDQELIASGTNGQVGA